MNGKKRDPKKVIRGIKHGRSGYNRGCGCLICSTDANRYARYYNEVRSGCTKLTFAQWKIDMGYDDDPAEMPAKTQNQINAKARKLTVIRGEGTDETDEDVEFGPPPPVARNNIRKPKPEPEPGPIEAAVIEECAALSLAAERPAMVMAARNMARICDDEKKSALHATANRQLTAVLNDLRGGSKKKSKGRLSRIQSMTKPTGTVGS